MIFDCHTDVLFDVINNNHSFEYHCLEMRNYKGAFLNYYFKGNESHDSFLFILQKIKEFYKTNFNILKNKNYILGIEGLGPLQDISDINLVFEAGIKIVTLTWNDMNSLATGTYTNKKRGLTNKGITFLKELENKNIILDLSHLNRKSVYDVLKIYQGPLIVSHSNVYVLCKNERNLTDKQLKLLKSKNVLVGVNTYKNFVGQNMNLESFVNIIDYLKDKIGIKNICLGLDFDYYLSTTTYSTSIKGLQSPKDLSNLYEELKKRKYSKSDIQDIFYQNIINFLKSSLIM